MPNRAESPSNAALVAGCITESGGLTARGRKELERLHALLGKYLADPSHRDNTDGWCRGGLNGHDCCYTCNDIGGALRGFMEEQ